MSVSNQASADQFIFFQSANSSNNNSPSSTRSSSPDESVASRSVRFSSAIRALARIDERVRQEPSLHANDLWPISWRAFLYFSGYGSSFLTRIFFFIFYVLHVIARFSLATSISIITISDNNCVPVLTVIAGILTMFYYAMTFVTIFSKCRMVCNTNSVMIFTIPIIIESFAIGWSINWWYLHFIGVEKKNCVSHSVVAVWLNWMLLTGFFYLFYTCIALAHIADFFRFTMKMRRQVQTRRGVLSETSIDFGIQVHAPFQDESNSSSGSSSSIEDLAAINVLKNAEESSSEISEARPVCAICADALFSKTKPPSPVVALQCQHQFHVECARLHFANQTAMQLTRSCPMCQMSVALIT